MNRFSFVAILLAAIYLRPVLAEVPQLDQQNTIAPGPPTSFTGVGYPTQRAQTFTVGISGLLSQVDLGLFNLDPRDTGTIAIDISQTIGGIPDFSPAGILAHHTIPLSETPSTNVTGTTSTPEFTVAVNVSSNNIYVSSGQQLAIIVSMDTDGTGVCFWWQNPPNVPAGYAGGSKFSYTPANPIVVPSPESDLHFRTYVTIPEPSTLAFLAIYTAACLARRHAR